MMWNRSRGFRIFKILLLPPSKLLPRIYASSFSTESTSNFVERLEESASDHKVTTVIDQQNRRNISSYSTEFIHFHEESEWTDRGKKYLLADVDVIPDFVTLQEEQQFDKDTFQQLRRLRYELEHWDDAIHKYREIEKSNWSSPICQNVIARMRALMNASDDRMLSSVHVLDLAQDGHIKPHVDSERYCGDVITGLSLLSDSVMRLVQHKEEAGNHQNHRQNRLVVDLYLKRLSLYVLKGTARYQFTHELLPSSKSYFNNVRVPRIGRRLAVICRLLPKE